MVNLDFVYLFSFVVMRMSGCILLNPIFGRSSIPAIYKVGLSLSLALAVTTYTNVTVPMAGGLLVFAVLLVKEFFTGYAFGFVITLFSYIISYGGEIMDQQMSMSMAKVYDPASNVNMSLSATVFNVLYMLLFFAANGHVTMIRLFMLTGEVIPYGQVAINPGLTEAVIGIFCQCTIMAVKFAMPIVFIELLVEVGVGIIMKAVPSINVFVINIQAKVLVGLVLMVLLFVPLSGFLENTIALMFDALETVLFAMAPA